MSGPFFPVLGGPEPPYADQDSGGMKIRPRETTQNLTIPAGMQGVTYGPAVLAKDVRIVVESGAIWRII